MTPDPKEGRSGVGRTALEERQVKVSVMKDVRHEGKGGTTVSGGPATQERANREQMIATAAYFRAEARGFVPGREMEDWLAAEQEFDAMPGGDE